MLAIARAAWVGEAVAASILPESTPGLLYLLSVVRTAFSYCSAPLHSEIFYVLEASAAVDGSEYSRNVKK